MALNGEYQRNRAMKLKSSWYSFELPKHLARRNSSSSPRFAAARSHRSITPRSSGSADSLGPVSRGSVMGPRMAALNEEPVGPLTARYGTFMPWPDMRRCHSVGPEWRNGTRSGDRWGAAFGNCGGELGSPRRSAWRTL